MRLPKVIASGEKYREEVARQHGTYTGKDRPDQDYFQDEIDFNYEEGGVSVDSSSANLVLEETDGGVKERTNYVLMQLYEQKGYDAFVETCLNMRSNNARFENSDSTYSHFKGETAEIYLYVTVMEYIKVHGLNWKLYPSLFLPKELGSDQITEIDLVLVAEEIVIVFEVKSYNGKVKITEECTLKSGSGPKNIYKQNGMHCRALQHQINLFNIDGEHGMISALFWFADGTLEDNRTPQNSQRMPALTNENIINYLNAVKGLTRKMWKPEVINKMDELASFDGRSIHKQQLGY